MMNSSSSSIMTGINNCQPPVYTFIPSFIPNMILLNGSIYKYYIEQLLVQLTNLESRLVTMSVSLHTQTVLRCLIIQVLNIKS